MSTTAKTDLIDTRAHSPSVAERLRRYIVDAVASYRARAEDRRMREKLADLPDSILLDIGVAEEEIPRIRSRERFTPRSWSDYRGSLRHYAG